MEDFVCPICTAEGKTAQETYAPTYTGDFTSSDARNEREVASFLTHTCVSDLIPSHSVVPLSFLYRSIRTITHNPRQGSRSRAALLD